MNEEQKAKRAEPLISVCISTYNRGKYIRECLDSVFAQTYSNLEVIVVDDASTDGTVDIVCDYGDKVRLIRRERNSRCADIPRAEAVRVANSEWCALMDSDDTWYPQKIERQVATLSEHPEWDMVHSYVMLHDEYTGHRYVRHEGVVPDGPWVAAELVRHCFICTSSVLVRKSVWLEAFDEVKPATFGTDGEMFLAVAKQHTVGFLPEVLVKYRKAPTGVSHGDWRRVENDLPGKIRILRKGLWRNVVSRSEMKNLVAYAGIIGAIHWREKKQPIRATWFLCNALRFSPVSPLLWSEVIKTLGRALWPR